MTTKPRFGVGAEGSIRRDGELAPDLTKTCHALEGQDTLCGLGWQDEMQRMAFPDVDWVTTEGINQCPACKIVYDKIVDEEANP